MHAARTIAASVAPDNAAPQMHVLANNKAHAGYIQEFHTP